jgi:hypothetical protein
LLRYDVADLRAVDFEWAVWGAIEHNDLLACGFARLNLWWLPAALPTRDQVDRAWEQYLEAWRPGKPKPRTWAKHWITAWERVTS